MKKIRSKIICGDALAELKKMTDASVQMCCTSPPYWGLRDYGVNGQLGLEKTPEEYVEKIVKNFREVKRALRDDGTLWLNLGDSYSGGGRGCNTPKQQSNKGTLNMPKSIVPDGLKTKDLIGIPWRVAFALQADGWYLRSDIIWSKPNPMPESVTDRPTKAHEYIFLLSKSVKYFYDAEAIKENRSTLEDRPDGGVVRDRVYDYDSKQKAMGRHDKQRGHSRPHAGFNNKWDAMSKEDQSANGRNKRTVWEIATQPFPEAHFAVFPEKLVEPCVKVGTSEKGACPDCGAPWERMMEKTATPHDGETSTSYKKGSTANRLALLRQVARERGGEYINESKTIGWRSSCKCGRKDAVPCTVLDPFSGAGTTGVVCKRLRREFIGIELKPEYVAMAEKRIEYCHRTGLKTLRIKKQKSKRGFF